MKPRTKLQHEVMRLSNDLKNEKYRLLPWAKKECLEHKGYATKNRVICMDCGETFSPSIVNRKRAVCTHCGTKIKVENTKKRTDNQRSYFALVQIVNNFQVIRNFELIAHYKAGQEAHFCCWEILQHWIREDGKHEVVARNHTTNWYCDTWSGDLEIRNNYYRYYSYSANKYDVYPYKYHASSKFKKCYKKYGINNQLKELTAFEAIRFIPENDRAETLLKAKQFSLLGLAHQNGCGSIHRYWPAIKICIRNKYKVMDAKMWTDYIDLLNYFNKDIYNAYYVCPSDLKKEHDRWMIKKRNIQKREENKQKRLKALNQEKDFLNKKSKFFGIVFSDKEIEVKVLDSVQAVMEEGDNLHHCVFINEYHLKDDSLLLSASVKGEKMETIEVSIKKLKIIQSRGLQNKPSEFHDEIIDLVNKNISQIKKCVKAKTKEYELSD